MFVYLIYKQIANILVIALGHFKIYFNQLSLN